MVDIAIGIQMVLLPPQPLRPEAQPYPFSGQVRFQFHKPGIQVSQPPSLLVRLIKLAALLVPGNLNPRPSNRSDQAVGSQFLLLPHRRYLAFQRHPHRVEHRCRYPT